MKIVNPRARAFYEIEASQGSWSVRELERQVAAMLFERLALKGDERQLASEGQRISRPADVIKDPDARFLPTPAAAGARHVGRRNGPCPGKQGRPAPPGLRELVERRLRRLARRRGPKVHRAGWRP